MSRIPDHAKKVFSGIIWDVYQWEQEQFDGTIMTYEGAKRLPSALIFAVQDGKIVICNEEQPGRVPFIGIPAGRFNSYDEDPLEAAKRELLEETGLTSSDWVLWQKKESNFMDWDSYIFIARDCKKTHEQEVDPGEKIEVELASLDEFLAVIDEGKDGKKFRTKNLLTDLENLKTDMLAKEEFKSLLGISKI